MSHQASLIHCLQGFLQCLNEINLSTLSYGCFKVSGITAHNLSEHLQQFFEPDLTLTIKSVQEIKKPLRELEQNLNHNFCYEGQVKAMLIFRILDYITLHLLLMILILKRHF